MWQSNMEEEVWWFVVVSWFLLIFFLVVCQSNRLWLFRFLVICVLHPPAFVSLSGFQLFWFFIYLYLLFFQIYKKCNNNMFLTPYAYSFAAVVLFFLGFLFFIFGWPQHWHSWKLQQEFHDVGFYTRTGGSNGPKTFQYTRQPQAVFPGLFSCWIYPATVPVLLSGKKGSYFVKWPRNNGTALKRIVEFS